MLLAFLVCRYGYVTPADVSDLLDVHIGKGEIIEKLWRYYYSFAYICYITYLFVLFGAVIVFKGLNVLYPLPIAQGGMHSSSFSLLNTSLLLPKFVGPHNVSH